MLSLQDKNEAITRSEVLLFEIFNAISKPQKGQMPTNKAKLQLWALPNLYFWMVIQNLYI